MKKFTALLLVIGIVFALSAADGKEVLLKAFNYMSDQGIKKYSCEFKFSMPNPFIERLVSHWEAPGTSKFEVFFTATCPEEQKALLKNAYPEVTDTAQQALDKLLTTMKIDSTTDSGKAYAVTLLPLDPAGQLQKLIYVLDKDYKIIGTSTISVNSSQKMKFFYTKIDGFTVPEKIETVTKVTYKNPVDGKDIDNETTGTTEMVNYQINK
ncbi:MAG: hypothetical protein PHQ23_11460 [Candidatus Wallbacteria bacterium]|nr:hypothetical protein [Candidatus Wallbacteria bacterium]